MTLAILDFYVQGVAEMPDCFYVKNKLTLYSFFSRVFYENNINFIHQNQKAGPR